eukprot:gene21148-biopygen13173
MVQKRLRTRPGRVRTRPFLSCGTGRVRGRFSLGGGTEPHGYPRVVGGGRLVAVHMAGRGQSSFSFGKQG